MGKQNPKHTKAHQMRKKILKNVDSQDFETPTSLFNVKNILNPPKEISKTRCIQIQSDFKEILMDIESLFMEYYHSENDYRISDNNVLFILASFLWINVGWKFKGKKCPNSVKEKLDFDFDEKGLYNQIIGILKTYYKQRLQIIKNQDSEIVLTNTQRIINDFNYKNFKKYSKENLWDCIATLYNSALFWMDEDENDYVSGYLEYISSFVSTRSEIEYGFKEEKFEEKNGESVTQYCENERRSLYNQLERKIIIQKEKYSKRELKGYGKVSDAIFQFQMFLLENENKLIIMDRISPEQNNQMLEQSKYVLDEIKEQFCDAINYIPDAYEINQALMAIEIYRKNYKESNKFFHMMPEEAKNDFCSYFLIGSAAMESGDTQEAIRIYKNACEKIEDEMDKSHILGQLGIAYMKNQDLEKAIVAFEKSLLLNPEEDYRQFEMEKIKTIILLNGKKKPKKDEIKVFYTNTFNYFNLIDLTIRKLDFVHFQDNNVLQDQLLRFG